VFARASHADHDGGNDDDACIDASACDVVAAAGADERSSAARIARRVVRRAKSETIE
jgi:hypothetical protein